MSAQSQDQRFLLLLLIGLVSGAWLIAGGAAQTFTNEDRGSILKFMDVLINFLDGDTDFGNSTEAPTTDSTLEPVESTTLSTNETESSTTSDASSESESTTLASNETTVSTTPTITSTSSSAVSSPPVRRRICFKRVCYKFANDRGYIY
ncbi:TBC1 domain family member 5 homolog B [Drosophila busckii]|uniref:TBC1 domain family member 5 homolog B n=1 Tax=Drosophila busckii TaxID=30019 RepID=UPI0014330B7A|nr:TBC1 domain family member 5 homolog B [Drosophila busckii]